MVNLPRIFFLSFLLIFFTAGQTRADDVKVTAQAQRSTIYLNMPFTFAVVVENGDDDMEVDTSALSDFTVVSQGRSSQSQTSRIYDQQGWRTIVHTSLTQTYLLTPRKAGSQIIPPVTVTVKGKKYQTAPVAITVQKPKEVDEYKLLLSLDKSSCYVGEPLTLTVRWLIAAEFQGYEFQLPILDDNRFLLFRQEEDLRKRQGLIKLTINNEEIIARRTTYFYQGRNYTAITFRYLCFIKEPGEITLPPSSLVVRSVAGYAQPDPNDPFALFGRERKYYKNIVIPAKESRITVKPLPREGRPAHFSGLVGQYSLAALAAPLTANVGDPLKLTLTVSGGAVIQVGYDDLDLRLPASDFKVSTEAPEEERDGTTIKSFTTTIRARHDGVTTIPAQHLSYFNPETKKYEDAASEAIDLTIRPTRIITALDAEGADADKENRDTPAPADRRESQNGIRHNYEEISFTAPQKSQSVWLWPLLLLGPALAGAAFIYRRRGSNHHSLRRKQVKQALRALARGRQPADDFLAYLAVKMQKKKESLTWHDVAPILRQEKINRELGQQVEEFFRGLDAVRFGGASAPPSCHDRDHLVRLANELEEVLP